MFGDRIDERGRSLLNQMFRVIKDEEASLKEEKRQEKVCARLLDHCYCHEASEKECISVSIANWQQLVCQRFC